METLGATRLLTLSTSCMARSASTLKFTLRLPPSSRSWSGYAQILHLLELRLAPPQKPSLSFGSSPKDDSFSNREAPQNRFYEHQVRFDRKPVQVDINLMESAEGGVCVSERRTNLPKCVRRSMQLARALRAYIRAVKDCSAIATTAETRTCGEPGS